MKGPRHMSLPALWQDPRVLFDDLVQQTDLTGVGVHNLDLLGFKTQNEIAGFICCKRIYSESKLQQEIKLINLDLIEPSWKGINVATKLRNSQLRWMKTKVQIKNVYVTTQHMSV